MMDPTTWERAFMPPKGCAIGDASRAMVAYKVLHPNEMVTFLFNDVPISVGEQDSVDTIVR